MVSFVNQILSISTLIAQIIIGLVIVSYIFRKSFKIFKKIVFFVSKNVLALSFTISLIAMLGSLFYSDIAKYNPCTLCWYQRILMYPQVFLFGLAIKKKDKKIIDYAILLSVIGLGIAVYHYLMQVGLFPGVCSVIGYSVSCSQRFVMQMGYITIPMMSVTAFAQILTFTVIHKLSQKSKKK